jgi:Zn-finger nucleic acid-binding protein
MEEKMKCPVCKDVNLVMSERQGIEIDYCPSCRGVWLDRGELDKIIERNLTSTSNSYSQNSYNEQKSHKEHHNKYDNHTNHGYHKKKKEGFLSEIFDFDF